MLLFFLFLQNVRAGVFGDVWDKITDGLGSLWETVSSFIIEQAKKFIFLILEDVLVFLLRIFYGFLFLLGAAVACSLMLLPPVVYIKFLAIGVLCSITGIVVYRGIEKDIFSFSSEINRLLMNTLFSTLFICLAVFASPKVRRILIGVAAGWTMGLYFVSFTKESLFTKNQEEIMVRATIAANALICTLLGKRIAMIPFYFFVVFAGLTGLDCFINGGYCTSILQKLHPDRIKNSYSNSYNVFVTQQLILLLTYLGNSLI